MSSCTFRALPWVVYAKKPFGGPQQVLDYLGRYTHRVAISNNRFAAIEEGRMSFRYKDYAHGNRRKTITLEASEFIRRFMLHVLPRGFMRIRHYGLLANRAKRLKLAQARSALDQPPAPPPGISSLGRWLSATSIAARTVTPGAWCSSPPFTLDLHVPRPCHLAHEFDSRPRRFSPASSSRHAAPGCARSLRVDPPCALCHIHFVDIEAASHAPPTSCLRSAHSSHASRNPARIPTSLQIPKRRALNPAV